MKTTARHSTTGKTLIAASVASILLAACAADPVKPDGAAELRSRLSVLQSNQDLAARAPLEIKEAEVAVRAAEEPQLDRELGAHRVYIADRKVELARAQAQTRLAEDERVALSALSERARLDARTREADTARAAVASAQEESVDLRQQLEALQAKPTDRGLVLTLGDVLFASGKADLRTGAAGNLGRLAEFLNRYPERTATIEGYTDSVGDDDFNQALSQRRADSVRSYLVGQGVAAPRLVATGRGEGAPVAGNDSAAGRQQNRRVEVVISNPPVAQR